MYSGVKMINASKNNIKINKSRPNWHPPNAYMPLTNNDVASFLNCLEKDHTL